MISLEQASMHRQQVKSIVTVSSRYDDAFRLLLIINFLCSCLLISLSQSITSSSRASPWASSYASVVNSAHTLPLSPSGRRHLLTTSDVALDSSMPRTRFGELSSTVYYDYDPSIVGRLDLAPYNLLVAAVNSATHAWSEHTCLEFKQMPITISGTQPSINSLPVIQIMIIVDLSFHSHVTREWSQHIASLMQAGVQLIKVGIQNDRRGWYISSSSTLLRNVSSDSNTHTHIHTVIS